MSDNTTQHFDIIVIGGGPGGYTAAVSGAQAGLSVALIEETDRLGGICLNWGCIPAKSLMRSAEVYETVRAAADYGVSISGADFRWVDIIARSREVVDRLSGGIDFLMKKNDIAVFRGKGTLEGSGTIRISGDTETVLTAADIILATGAHPAGIPGVTIDRETVITSREAMILEKRPETIVIAGGGAIGIEFAYFFNAFGTDVTLLEAEDTILPVADREIARRLKKSLKDSGITVKTSAAVSKAEPGDRGCLVTFTIGDETETIEAEKLLIATGSRANIENIGLEAAGVDTADGWITVDDMCRTSAEHIYAIGDCIGPPLLAHAASMEAECAVDAVLGNESEGTVQRCIPNCIYAKPQVAWAGLTEQQARDNGDDIAVGKYPFRSNGQAAAIGESDGMVKAIVSKTSGNILGLHIIGHGATENIQEAALAIENGISAQRLIKTVHPHPSLSEAVKEAVAGALGTYNST